MIYFGCTPRYTGYGPHFPAVEPHLKKIAILTPDFSTFEVSGGGIPEYREDWSALGRNNLRLSLNDELTRHRFEGILVDSATLPFSTDTLRIFIKQIAGAIQRNLYGRNPFLCEINEFSYSIGSIAELCDHLESDAVLFIFGMDEKYSDLRVKTLSKEADLKTARSACFSTISLILLGSATYTTYRVPNETTYLYCLIADRSGKVVWFKKYLKADDADFLKLTDTQKLAKEIVSGLNRKVSQ